MQHILSDEVFDIYDYDQLQYLFSSVKMNQEPIVEETLVNILRTVANSSLPLYEMKLEQMAVNEYPQHVDDVRNIVFTELRRIFGLVNTPTVLLSTLYDAQSTTWFEGVVNPHLIVEVDMILRNIYGVLKNINDEITLLQQKQSRSDFIGDLFFVVKRDISGGALIFQHRISAPHTGIGQPFRQYYHCCHRFATHLGVIAAIEHKWCKSIYKKYIFVNEIICISIVIPFKICRIFRTRTIITYSVIKKALTFSK
jgi:hypothetical protein